MKQKLNVFYRFVLAFYDQTVESNNQLLCLHCMKSVGLVVRYMVQKMLDIGVCLHTDSEDKNTFVKETREGEEKKYTSKGNESR